MKFSILKKIAIASAVTSGAFLSVNLAMAADAADGVDTTYAAPASSAMFSNVSLTVGAYALVNPLYEGSDKYGIIAFPLLYPTFGESTERSRLAIRGLDDIRFSAVRLEGLDIGPVLGYRMGRKMSLDASRLTGLGDVNGGLVVGGFASYTAAGAFVDAAASKQVTGLTNSGFTARFGAGYEAPITGQLTGKLYASAVYASNDYMDRYFSVTALQTPNAGGYGVFNARGGVKNVDVNASLNFQATEKFSITSSAGYSRLLNDAAASPISVTNNQFSGGLGLFYKF